MTTYYQKKIKIIVHSDWIPEKWLYEEKNKGNKLHISPDLEHKAKDMLNHININSLNADVIVEI